ncbi:MAG: phytoene/squalene synthase family protein [Candidatus Wenzhouxiangella sp. M2_3B_020]
MQTDALGRHAEDTIAEGSKSFAAAARLFRPAMRRDVMLLYTWCRHCDDVTDGQQLGHGRLDTAGPEIVERLKADSLAACAGQPRDTAPFRALAEVAERHELPVNVVADHLAGFERDVNGWRPEDIDDLLEYCYFVAGAVGILMARIMGIRDHVTLARACDLGLAFQLTNVARDVVEDAEGGRCYLPATWLAEHGLRPDDLADPARADDVFPLVARLVETAEPYYASARVGERALPARAAWAIATARAVYRDIGRMIVRRGPAALAQRSFTGRGRKTWRMLGGGAQALGGRLRRGAGPARDGLWTPAALKPARA